MLASLDTLVRNLNNSLPRLKDKQEAFCPVHKWHQFMPGMDSDAVNPEIMLEHLGRLTKKGVYPYELVKKVEELFCITFLPTREEFASRLRGKQISKEEHYRV